MWWAYIPLVLGVVLWGRFIWKYGMPYRPTNIKVPKPVELPPEMDFNWLRDYGAHWKPGDTAFWLEPTTCDELASWCSKYAPTQYGLVVANDDIRIEWMEPAYHPALPPNPYPYMSGLSHSQNPYANGLQNAYNLQQLLGRY